MKARISLKLQIWSLPELLVERWPINKLLRDLGQGVCKTPEEKYNFIYFNHIKLQDNNKSTTQENVFSLNLHIFKAVEDYLSCYLLLVLS